MQSCLFCFPASLRRYRLRTGSTMCPPLCIRSLFATSVVSSMSKLLHQTQHSKIAALAHRWQQIKLVQLEQVLLVPRGDHKDTWLGCSAAPEWLQLMQVELIPTRLSLFLCVVLTLVWCSGREWWKKMLPPSLFNPQPRVGQHPEYVTLTLARAFMFVALPSPPKRGTYLFFFSAEKWFEILQRTGSLWKYRLVWDCQLAWGHHLCHCGRSELTAWSGLHWHPEEGTSKNTSSAQN